MMIPNQKGQMEEQIDFSKTTEIKCENCGMLIVKNDIAKHKKTKKCINTEPEKIISVL